MMVKVKGKAANNNLECYKLGKTIDGYTLVKWVSKNKTS